MDGTEVALNRKKLLELHPAMRKRVLRKAMAEFLSADVSQVQIEALEDLLKKETGKSRDFLEGIHAENRYDVLVLSLKQEKAEGYQYALFVDETVVIPENTWAVFPCKGPMPESLQKVNTEIFSEWLPGNSDYEIAGMYNIEYYTAPGDYPKGNQDENYYCEIWMPVKSK